MATFKYSAMNSEGKEVSGIVEEQDENSANGFLRAKGLYPTSITEDRRGQGRKRPARDKAEREKTLAAMTVPLLILLVLSLAANAMFATMLFCR